MAESKQKLSSRALKAALTLRKKMEYQLWEPLCVNDLVDTMNIILKYEDIKSAEGLYIKDPGPAIIIGAHRPIVRQNFSCAHELGHHIFGHGTKLDEFINHMDFDQPFDEDEFLADCFAGFLLMPKVAVQNAFNNRQWSLTQPEYEQFFIISGLLGVGYTTLVKHMRFSLKMLNKNQTSVLLSKSPAKIKQKILSCDSSPENLIIVDKHWLRPTINILVGDMIVVPLNTDIHSDFKFVKTTQYGDVFQSNAVGITRISNIDFGLSVFVRTSKKEYFGLNKYKHLEDI